MLIGSNFHQSGSLYAVVVCWAQGKYLLTGRNLQPMWLLKLMAGIYLNDDRLMVVVYYIIKCQPSWWEYFAPMVFVLQTCNLLSPW